MDFRLLYQGKLPAEGRGSASAIKDKHAIRQAIHKQLVTLWKTHPFIAQYAVRPEQKMTEFHNPDRSGKTHWVLWPRNPRSTLDDWSEKFAMCGYRFAPLVGTLFGEGTETVCSLDILFLRRDAPGSVVSGGDIDNRLKVLFDALRMPKNCDEVKGFTPQPDETPFLCLLEDDSLITEVHVTTDQLLTPLATEEHVNDVHLVIHVKTSPIGPRLADVGPLPPPPTRRPWER